jgi:ribosomal protein S27AE
VCASAGAHDDDSKFLANQIRLHIEYVKRKRILHGELADSPPNTLPCSTCARPLRLLRSACQQCGAAVKVCGKCKSAQFHEHNSHSRGVTESADWSSKGFCHECDCQLSRSWYQSKDGTEDEPKKMCRSCAQIWFDATDTTSWVSNSTLTDKWGDVNVYAGAALVVMQEELQTFTRIYELTPECHEKLMFALSAFSLRPYFTRLWVS